MATPRITLEQWRALIAVVEAGGYAQAAEALHKSQSSISYAIHKMEQQLGLAVFERQGRKSVLTDTGRLLTRRARLLLAEAGELETAACKLAAGWEAEVRLAVDHLFPVQALFCALDQFSATAPLTRIDLLETVLSGGDEALHDGAVDLAILPGVPPGYLGEPLLHFEFIAVAHPAHPLHQLPTPIRAGQLRQHRQLVLRDSGRQRRRDAGWLGAEQRWTVSYTSTAIRAVASGLGFGWFPRHHIESELADGRLRELALAEGARRSATLQLVYRDRDYAGEGTRHLAELLHAAAAGSTAPESAPAD